MTILSKPSIIMPFISGLSKYASKHPRKLVETLAEDLAEMILSEFAVREVTIEIEKFILPDTESVGVAVTRTKLS